MIQVNILWDFKDESWGGGNQFLRILRKFLREQECYAESPEAADVILVNSKDKLPEAAWLKQKYSSVCVHRIDGIFSLYRGEHERHNDQKVYDFNKQYADGSIFQSHWSKEASFINGMAPNVFEKVIHNCSDMSLFNHDKKILRGGKIRLITTSWSDNIKKGFDIYKMIDNQLDFNKFEYVFVGRSPFSFKNIQSKGILNSAEIASELKQAHIFVTATQVDACSNSLIEALSCGLPSVALNSGGSPELVKEGGVVFDSDNVIESINEVADNLSSYASKIQVDSILGVGPAYYNFMEEVFNEKKD